MMQSLRKRKRKIYRKEKESFKEKLLRNWTTKETKNDENKKKRERNRAAIMQKMKRKISKS